MTDICEWCVKTSEQIDSLEYECEKLKSEVLELKRQLSDQIAAYKALHDLCSEIVGETNGSEP